MFCISMVAGAGPSVRAIVQIAHGMCETGIRYEELAELLTAHGYAVYCNDHRGHGQTSGLTLGDAGEDGFEGMIEDLLLLASELKKRHAGVPHYLMGHSMGSFDPKDHVFERRIIRRIHSVRHQWSTGTAGVRFESGGGTNAPSRKHAPESDAERHRVRPLQQRFRPYSHSIRLVIRDETEVDKYINDPYCGQVCALVSSVISSSAVPDS